MKDAKYRSLNLKQFKDLVFKTEKERVVLVAKSEKYTGNGNKTCPNRYMKTVTERVGMYLFNIRSS